MFYFIGPESKIYHNDQDCPRLHNPLRHWPISASETIPEGRQLCADCEWRRKLREQAIMMLAFKPAQRVEKRVVVRRMHCSEKVAHRILAELDTAGLIREEDGSLLLTSAGNAVRNELTNNMVRANC